MKLIKHRVAFTRMIPRLIDKAFEMGFEVSGGDLFRDPSCPYGSQRSKHHKGLAIDLNLYMSGEYLEDTQDHQYLGEWWESQGGIWGGRFGDGNHYEWPESV